VTSQEEATNYIFIITETTKEKLAEAAQLRGDAGVTQPINALQ
jgi:hypothetical protein